MKRSDSFTVTGFSHFTRSIVNKGSEGILFHLKVVVIHEGTEGSDLCPSPENKFTKMKENIIGIECILSV